MTESNSRTAAENSQARPETRKEKRTRLRIEQSQRDKAKHQASIIFVVECDYCGEPAECVTGKELYPHRPDLADKIAWQCKSCESHVGCHPGTTKPLGRLANEQLRKLKMQAYSKFDPIWRSGDMKRKQAYRWLAGELEIEPKHCHIGMFDEEMCERTVEACNERMMT